MAVFHTMQEVRNLAPVPLKVTFDGQTTEIPPGVSFIPKVTVQFAMNQNPIMGTADADNPNISGGKYLIVPVGTKYDRAPLNEEEWAEHLGKPCRINTDEFFEDRLGPKERVVSRGKGRKTQARSRFDAGVSSEGMATIDRAAE
jgi:hypothetical protein